MSATPRTSEAAALGEGRFSVSLLLSLAAILVLGVLCAGTASAGTYNYAQNNYANPGAGFIDGGAGAARCVYRKWNRAYSNTGAYQVREYIQRCSDGVIVYASSGALTTQWGPAGSFYPGIYAVCLNDDSIPQHLTCSTTVP